MGDKKEKGKGEGKFSSIKLVYISMESSLEKADRLDVIEVFSCKCHEWVYGVSAE